MSDIEEAENRSNFQVFLKGDRDKKPVRFFLHGSLTVGQQEKLERDVTNNGGVICEDERESDVILVHHEAFGGVANRYAHSKTIYVEQPEFVIRCLKRKQYFHDIPLKKSVGGRTVGSERTEFTGEDDMHLASYLANLIPDPEAGGRKGFGVYKQLCADIRKTDYKWAKRHTWQSWRNRYRTNQERLDQMIEDYLIYNPPHPDGKGEYPHDRRAAGLGRRSAAGRHRYVGGMRQEEEEDDEEEEDEERRTAAKPGREPGEHVERAAENGVTQARISRRRLSVDPEGTSSDGGRKRRKLSAGDAIKSPSTPEQVRRGQQNDSAGMDPNAVTEKFHEVLDDDELLRFDEDNEYFPDLADLSPAREAGPINTQATLVATQPVPPAAVKANARGRTLTPSLPSSMPRKAERNKERSVSAKAGATGRKVLPISPLRDSQATVVATQRKVLSPTQPQTTQARMVSNPISEGAALPTRAADLPEPIRAGSVLQAGRNRQPSVSSEGDNDTRDAIMADIMRPSRQQDVLRKAVPTAISSGTLQGNTASRRSISRSPSRAVSNNIQEVRMNKRLRGGNPMQAQGRRADAPYRNTRARSRSVEPQAMPPPRAATSNRKGGKDAMQIVEEREDENEHHDSDSNAEMNDEEQSIDLVEKTLGYMKAEEKVESDQEEEEEGEEEEEAEAEEEDSMETSESDRFFLERAQDIKKRNLLMVESKPRAEERREEAEAEAEEEESESELESESDRFFVQRARDIKKKNLTRVESAPQTRRPSRPSFPANIDLLSTTQSRLKATPRREESSEGEFPTPGTRSKEAKIHQEQLEKEQPFTPTPGTRAEGARAVQLAQKERPRFERVARKTKQTATR